ncbi:alpha/beta hydrolase [Marivivens niveibacter]|uniref:Palmitoyl-protein thioesterase ABHD10, mitochondrial n=1 Tax=Marivivens niveibacter TaxID=1930667 RepID=A0A251WZB6_9RHOB|nr:alpha/beta hydrolase [Marivivens niveibacter]OUD09283.1 alpha/beta hydrolase [Marivivens niveibacter]
MTEYLTTPQNRRIAYNLTAGKGPTVVFCGGLKSDMEGTKAIALEEWAKKTGHGFLRFDYSGHGISDGKFEDGCIGDWFEDASAAIDLIDGKVLLVGSSMGGWVSLLLSRERADKVAGLVTIAGAPDFTEDGYWASFSDAEKDQVMTQGRIEIPNEYVEPYVITRRLIEDGRDRLILRSPLAFDFPVRILQGSADDVVKQDVAERLFAHAAGNDIQLTVVKGADHRFSDDTCLAVIEHAVSDILQRV